MTTSDIINALPYDVPFLFVDEIIEVANTGIKGTYTYSEKLEFYKGHFKEYPVTPGVILTETMAQIGVVCLGIYLLSTTTNKDNGKASVALTSSNIEFLKPVFPNEKVWVVSEKIYFRFGKLKCNVKMINKNEEVVCMGEIAGMLISKKE